MKRLKKVCVASAVFVMILSMFNYAETKAPKITTVLKAENSWDGVPIVYPAGKAEVTGLLIEIAPGGETGWHMHTAPSFAMVLEGQLDVHLKDGRVKSLKAGDTLAEVVNTLHNGCNAGTVPVKLIVFYAGVVDKAITVKESLQK